MGQGDAHGEGMPGPQPGETNAEGHQPDLYSHELGAVAAESQLIPSPVLEEEARRVAKEDIEFAQEEAEEEARRIEAAREDILDENS